MTMTVGNRVGRLALLTVVLLAAAGAGFGPARAASDNSTDAANAAGATDPTEVTSPAEAAEAAGPASAANANESADKLTESPSRRRHKASPLDRRVNLLAKELGLDATQKTQVKKVLEDQREQVTRVWNDESIPAARRVSATQAIGDRTADQIRALLNDEQRKKYIQPRQREVAVGTAGGNAESWMKSGKGK